MKETDLAYRMRCRLIRHSQFLGSLLTRDNWRFPRGVQVETCTACNRRCHYCANYKAPFGSQRFMKDSVYLCFLSQLAGMKWRRHIAFNFFNEPLGIRASPAGLGWRASDCR